MKIYIPSIPKIMKLKSEKLKIDVDKNITLGQVVAAN